MRSHKHYLTRGRILLTQGRIELGSFWGGTEGQKSFRYGVASKNLGSEMTNNFSRWSGKHFLKGGVAKFFGGV